MLSHCNNCCTNARQCYVIRALPVTLELRLYIYMGLTFIGPCIVIYFYSKTNKMHKFF